jgi:raffinose/stachyose/melibiose transport system permease protein
MSTPTIQKSLDSRPNRKDAKSIRALARRDRPRKFGARFVVVLLCIYGLIALGPLLLMVVGSFRTSNAIFNNPLGFEWPPTVRSYILAWQQAHFSVYFINSLLVTVGSVLISTVVSVLAAYALARARSRAMQILEAIFLSGLMLPIQLAILPIFHLLDGFRLIDSLFGLTLVYAASGIPFSIFVLTAFFRQLPEDLEEASVIDGAGAFRRFWSVMVPLVRPAIAAVAIFRFVPVWNDFLYPLVLLRSNSHYTLPVGLASFFGQYQTNWSLLFAGLVIATIPLIALFLLASKQVIAGLTAGMGK